MKWLTVAVKAKFGWPTEETEIEYLGCKYLLRPESDEDAQSVSLLCPPGADMESGRLLVNRFLSALSWAEEEGITELFSIGSYGERPARVGKSNARFIAHKYKADYLPEPKEEKSLRALALFREAQSLNSPTYAFLGFFKVLNVLFDRGATQKTWINNNISAIKDYRASKRLEELRESQEDIGQYLYVQGRCAVAHAFSEPAIDPDIPSEIQRLSEDLPLIKELAVIAIEDELGIISKSTYHSTHIYELEGFESLLGGELVGLLKKGQIIEEDTQIDIPSLSLRLRDSNIFQTYENLSPVSAQRHGSLLIIHPTSPLLE